MLPSDTSIKFSVDSPNAEPGIRSGKDKIYFIKRALIDNGKWWRSNLIEEFRKCSDPLITERHHNMSRIIEAGLPFSMARGLVSEEKDGTFQLNFDNGHHRTAFLYTIGLDEIPMFSHDPNFKPDRIRGIEKAIQKGWMREATAIEVEEILSNTKALTTHGKAITQIESEGHARIERLMALARKSATPPTVGM